MAESLGGATKRWVLSSSLLLGLALLLGRATGFIRELVIAGRLGVSADADVAVLVLALPDLLVNLLLSGGLSVALVPAMKAAPERAVRLFLQASVVVGLLFGLLALSFVLLPQWWFWAIAPGVAVPPHLLGTMAAALALAIPVSGLSGVSTAYLHSRERFFVAGCGTLFFNLCVLAVLLFGGQQSALLTTLCWAVLGGATLRWVSQLLAMPAGGIRQVGGGWLLSGPILRSFAQGLAAAALLVLAPAVVRALASLTGEGSVAAVNYATKMIELPVGVLLTTLATVAFPRLSELYVQGGAAQAGAYLRHRLQRALLIAWLVVGFCVLFVDAFVDAFFGYGAMGSDAVAQVARLASVAVLGVPFVASSALLAADLNAKGQAGKVLKITLISLLLLPVMALPAIRNESAVLLVWALVGFQAIHAALLWRAVSSKWLNLREVLTPRILVSLSILLLPMGAAYAAHLLLADANDWLRVSVLIAFFVCSFGIGIRLHRWADHRAEGSV